MPTSLLESKPRKSLNPEPELQHLSLKPGTLKKKEPQKPKPKAPTMKPQTSKPQLAPKAWNETRGASRTPFDVGADRRPPVCWDVL